MNYRASAGAFALIAGLLGSSVPGLAQNSPTLRIRGAVETVDGQMLKVKSRDGEEFNVHLAENLRVVAVVTASFAELKPGSYIGVTGLPTSDGRQQAVEIHIFSEASRGIGEGQRPWDYAPESTMTNAAIDPEIGGIEGNVLNLKFKGGEAKVFVTPETVIVGNVPGDKSEIKPGSKIIIFGATKGPDGILEVPAIAVGRDGLTPPM
jgi:hypothetical protein